MKTKRHLWAVWLVWMKNDAPILQYAYRTKGEAQHAAQQQRVRGAAEVEVVKYEQAT